MEFWRLLPAISTFCDQCKRLRPSEYLEGLWYPIVIAAVSFVVGMVYIKIKIKRSRIKNTAMNQLKKT
jgi:hypothetical protein